MTQQPPASDAESAVRSRKLVRRMWILVVVVVTIALGGAGAVYLSGSPAVCGLCHEMQPSVATWKTSEHAQVGCPSCHETPRPLYRFPETLGVRASMMNRDFKAHFGDKSVAARPSVDSTTTIPDAQCLRCHDLSRSVTLRSGLLIDHNEHAKRNNSCVSCHLWTAHPLPAAEKPLLLMARCFTCHGRGASAKAPGTCGTCHPKGFNERPLSHTPNGWKTKHGKASLTGKQPCAMCHEPSFCRNCHGVEIPHPADWVRGKPGHSTVGAQNRQVCAQCHTEKPDLCSMCHHKDFSPTGGPWISQHPAMVTKRGTAFCMQCHGPVFCFDCHTKKRVITPPAQ